MGDCDLLAELPTRGYSERFLSAFHLAFDSRILRYLIAPEVRPCVSTRKIDRSIDYFPCARLLMHSSSVTLENAF